MGLAVNKGLALRYATQAVADELGSCLDNARYARVNNWYNESKETQIEWLEALLKKLTNMSKNTFYPMLGYTTHIGRLLKEFSEERWGYGCGYNRSQMAYGLFMEYHVADGFLAENNLADPLVDANASIRSGV